MDSPVTSIIGEALWRFELVDRLRRDGIAKLPWGFASLVAFRQHLAECQTYLGHVHRADSLPGTASPWTCYPMTDVLRAPGWLAQALQLSAVAEEFLEAEPRLYSLNAMWTKRPPQPLVDLQTWHRDYDDEKFLVLFLYGTDVLAKADGPHQFIRGSHLRGGDHDGRGPVPGDPMLGAFGPPGSARAETIYGPAGTMFLAATRGFHRGLAPRRGRRLLAWARFGVSERPRAYQWDNTEPVPLDSVPEAQGLEPRLKRVIRLVCR